jgi:hypothetical protein
VKGSELGSVNFDGKGDKGDRERDGLKSIHEKYSIKIISLKSVILDTEINCD